MKSNDSVCGATALFLAVIATNAHSESLRCNGDLAQIGDSKGTIVAKCGEPMFTDSFCEPIEQNTSSASSDGEQTTINVTQCETVDVWTYNPGSGQFFTNLRFERGALKSMKYGDRVP